MCRMIAGVGNIDVDWVIDAAIMMSDGMRTAAEVHLRGGLTLRAITAPCFLGTKIEAFRGRGRGDYFASHDLEDFITVVDGRTSLLDEVAAASVELRRFVGEAVGALFAEPRFLDALPGYLLQDEANQARIAQLVGNCTLSIGSSQFLDSE